MRGRRRALSHEQYVTRLVGPRPQAAPEATATPNFKVRSSTGIVHAAHNSTGLYITACTGRSLTGMGTDEPVTCKACVNKGFGR
jgi:hypothetical protein